MERGSVFAATTGALRAAQSAAGRQSRHLLAEVIEVLAPAPAQTRKRIQQTLGNQKTRLKKHEHPRLIRYHRDWRRSGRLRSSGDAGGTGPARGGARAREISALPHRRVADPLHLPCRSSGSGCWTRCGSPSSSKSTACSLYLPPARPRSRSTSPRATSAEVAQTWQVLRSEFDQMLMENARAKGALVLEETTVKELLQEDGRTVGVKAQDQVGASAGVPRAHDAGLLRPRSVCAHPPELAGARSEAQQGGGVDLLSRGAARPGH